MIKIIILKQNLLVCREVGKSYSSAKEGWTDWHRGLHFGVQEVISPILDISVELMNMLQSKVQVFEATVVMFCASELSIKVIPIV